MLPLLRRCVDEDHGDSWSDFLLLMEKVALRPVRRLLKRFRIDPQEAEEVVQDVIVLLLKDERQKLRSFQGNSRPKLAAWLKCTAVNFTLDWLDKRCRRQNHEQPAISAREPNDSYRSTEIELFELLDDLKANLNNREIEKLEILAGIRTPACPIPKRTLRRWRRQLREKGRGS